MIYNTNDCSISNICNVSSNVQAYNIANPHPSLVPTTLFYCCVSFYSYHYPISSFSVHSFFNIFI